jgi:hypothetical protein
VKKILCAAVVATIAIAPLQVQAGEVGALVTGGVLGGLVGSIYETGASATASSVGTAVAGTAAVIPAAATGVAATIAATSTPILLGVAVGGAAAYIMYNLVN